MKIPKEKVLERVESLSVLPGYPTNPAGQIELARAVTQHCATEFDLWELIDDIVATFERCPVPVHIHAMVAERRAQPLAMGPNCPTCNDLGGIRRDGRWAACQCKHGLRFDPEFADLPYREQLVRDSCHALDLIYDQQRRH